MSSYLKSPPHDDTLLSNVNASYTNQPPSESASGFSAINFGNGNFKPIPASTINIPPPQSVTTNFSFVSSTPQSVPTSSKDKKKLVVACAGCRRKKIKCSGHRPACTNCLRINVDCEYPIVRNRGSRYGYTKMLNRRLEALKVYCAEESSENSSQISHSSSTTGGIPVGGPPIGDEQRIIQEIELRAESRSKAVQLKKHSTSSTDSNVTINGVEITPADERAANIITGLRSGDSSPKKSNPEIESLLPPFDIIIHLAEVYFKYVHNQTYCFLHKPTFMIRLRKGEVNKGLVLALCGLAARFSRHPQIAKPGQPPYKAGEVFAQRARQVLSTDFDTPSVEAVQAMICLTQHDFFKYKGGKAMIYISMAMSMALNLGLNKELPDDSAATWLERECRRRTFWSLVVLDRLGHSTNTYSVQLNEISNILLPCPYHNFENNIPILTITLTERNADTYPERQRGVFSYHVEAALLWNKVNRYVATESYNEDIPPWKPGSKFEAIEKEFLKFKNTSIPSKLQYSKSSLNELSVLNRAGTYLHLHAELLAAQFLLYRTMYPYDTSRQNFSEQPPKEFIERAAHNVRDAANSMAEIVNDILQLEDSTVAPFISFCVFTVSSVHVALSFSPDTVVAGRAKQNLALTLRLLVILREYWYIVGVWCVMLKDRYTKKVILSKESKKRDYLSISGGNGVGDKSTPENHNANDRSTPTNFSRPGTPPAYLPEDLIKHEAPSNGGSAPPSQGPTRPGSPSPTRLNHPQPTSPTSLNIKRIKLEMSNTGQQPILSADSNASFRDEIAHIRHEFEHDMRFEVDRPPSSQSLSTNDPDTVQAAMRGDDILHDDGAEWLNALDKNYFDFGNMYSFDPMMSRPQQAPAMHFNADKEQSILEHILENVMDKVPSDDLY